MTQLLTQFLLDRYSPHHSTLIPFAPQAGVRQRRTLRDHVVSLPFHLISFTFNFGGMTVGSDTEGRE